METWNLKLVNIQKTANNFDCGERGHMTEMEQAALSYSIDDLIRIPANSKSRFSLESQYAASEQTQHCNRCFAVVGINSDLVNRPTLIDDPMDDPFQPLGRWTHSFPNSPRT